MNTIKQSKGGIDYLLGVLNDKAKTITRVCLWRIPHNTQKTDIRLKVGRYIKSESGEEVLETEAPKSQLTLTNEELENLLAFLSENYEPFKKGIKRYIPISEGVDQDSIDYLRAVLSDPDKQAVLDLIVKNNIFPEDILASLQNKARQVAVKEFEEMLEQDLLEQVWLEWFKLNDWVLGSEFVRILDERKIDTQNISDFLMQAHDGVLDIIEIKRPAGELRFWADSQDHNNYYQSSDLTKAITQANNYIYEVEREANSIKFYERVGDVKTIKPRCVLIFGRSYDWNDQQKEAYRILVSSHHNLTIMTYDHVLSRAKRILGLVETDADAEEVIEPF